MHNSPRPKVTESASASDAGMTANPSPTTIALSRSPHPANETGMEDISMMRGSISWCIAPSSIRNDIWPVFHYVPLHSSPAGQRYGRAHGSLTVTIDQSERLVRLPLWVGLTEQQQHKIVEVLKTATNFLC